MLQTLSDAELAVGEDLTRYLKELKERNLLPFSVVRSKDGRAFIFNTLDSYRSLEGAELLFPQFDDLRYYIKHTFRDDDDRQMRVRVRKANGCYYSELVTLLDLDRLLISNLQTRGALLYAKLKVGHDEKIPQPLIDLIFAELSPSDPNILDEAKSFYIDQGYHKKYERLRNVINAVTGASVKTKSEEGNRQGMVDNSFDAKLYADVKSYLKKVAATPKLSFPYSIIKSKDDEALVFNTLYHVGDYEGAKVLSYSYERLVRVLSEATLKLDVSIDMLLKRADGKGYHPTEPLVFTSDYMRMREALLYARIKAEPNPIPQPVIDLIFSTLQPPLPMQTMLHEFEFFYNEKGYASNHPWLNDVINAVRDYSDVDVTHFTDTSGQKEIEEEKHMSTTTTVNLETPAANPQWSVDLSKLASHPRTTADIIKGVGETVVDAFVEGGKQRGALECAKGIVGATKQLAGQFGLSLPEHQLMDQGLAILVPTLLLIGVEILGQKAPNALPEGIRENIASAASYAIEGASKEMIDEVVKVALPFVMQVAALGAATIQKSPVAPSVVPEPAV